MTTVSMRRGCGCWQKPCAAPATASPWWPRTGSAAPWATASPPGTPCLSRRSRGRASPPTAAPAPLADCTQLGLKALAPKLVDLVVSGPNNGINTAGDLLYSGTVAAAMEGREAGRESHRPVRACGGGQAHGGAGVLKAPGPAGLESGRAPGAEHQRAPTALGGNPRRAGGPPRGTASGWARTRNG